ncbi:siroheme synthase CysG [Rhodopseudomonas palustris]|uniref:siroheme synthase CysG n=1 Tax=Rhodopseudomonas palustris TaxID=1076 RepID=UPI0022F0F891|nr:siroheme synthase CysG [Rhodopseudomonas palustris]WBU29310.1 siroheme synthase CysG [Rhodopseudomonas palustris]
MRFLPVFLDLATGPVVLVGAGEMARAKLRLLLGAGASVRWYVTDGDRGLAGMTEPERSRISFPEGDPLHADLTGAIALLCAGAGDVAAPLAAKARALGVPVNVMDELSHSTFIFPAIVDRGDVVVAIGTGGSSPVVARRLRELIETVVPARIGELAALIGRWRTPIKARIPEFPLRRRFWERVVDGPIGRAVLEGRLTDAETELKTIDDATDYARHSLGRRADGHVSIVGAGPGDPDLLTLKALRALSDADVVFYDELVSPEILDRIRRDARRVPVGRRVGQPGIGQDAINKLLIETARSGQRAVRLKGGDPFVFGRGGEEVEALREAGVSYSVVPGISAALGAASQFEVPLTYRHEALRITFLTAHKAKDAETVDWSALTDQKMTVVVYMGMSAAPTIREGLLAAGRAADTPVGVFARVTRSDAVSAVGTLDDLPALVDQVDGGPALLVIGDVVAHSAPWRQQQLLQLVSTYQMAAE